MADGSGFNRTQPVRTAPKVKYRRRTKNNTKYPMNRLPFVAPSPAGRTMWAMPKANGYGTGCDMGKAAAQAFMKALRASDIRTEGSLQNLVIDIMRSGVDLNDHGAKGQIVGFFSYLGYWLHDSARAFGASLDQIKESDITAAMTRAANETEDEHTERYSRWLRQREAAGEVKLKEVQA